MRAAGKKSMHRLVIDDAFDHQFFGIVSHEPDYKTSLKLNEIFNISLCATEPVKSTMESNISFSRFAAKSKYNDLSYQLVKNRCESSTLSKNYPALDYLFVLCGSITGEMVEETQKILREINGVTAVFILNKDLLTDEYLILQN